MGTLDLGLIIAGSRYRGDFEKRLKRVISDIQLTQCYILVIDEVHTLVGAGAAEGSLDAANILKPALARGEFQCIGATTLSEYRKYIEPDAALARRFQSVIVEEPSVDDTMVIINGIREKYEVHHLVRITRNAIEDSVILSSRYINDRFLPDKAIDIIDEACSRVRVSYEIIPDMCQQFEEQILAIVREKDAAYKDKDWINGLVALREQVKATQAFIGLLYKIIERCKQLKQIWLIRAIQQRYQFVLRGITPLLKEWEIVLEIYENDRIVQNLETKLWEWDESEKTTELDKIRGARIVSIMDEKIKITEEGEQELKNLQAQLKNEPTADFLNKPPLNEDGKQFEYDESRPNESDSEFNETNPYVEQELDQIEKQIENNKDKERSDELQKKFDKSERLVDNPELLIGDKDEFYNRIIYNEPTILENTITEIEDVDDEEPSKKFVVSDEEYEANKDKYEAISEEELRIEFRELDEEILEEDDPVNKFNDNNEVAVSLVKAENVSVGAKQLNDLLAEVYIPFDSVKIPRALAKTVQKRLFSNLFTPFTPQIDRSNSLTIFKAREEELNEILEIKSDEDKKSDPNLQDLEKFLKIKKLWYLFTFMSWNRIVTRRSYKQNIEITKKETKKL